MEVGEGDIDSNGSKTGYDSRSLVVGGLWQVRPYQVAAVAPSPRSGVLADAGADLIGWDERPSSRDPLGSLAAAFNDFELGAMERHAETARAFAEESVRNRERHALLQAKEAARAEAAKHGAGGLTGNGAGTETAVVSSVLAAIMGAGALAKARRNAEA